MSTVMTLTEEQRRKVYNALERARAELILAQDHMESGHLSEELEGDDPYSNTIAAFDCVEDALSGLHPNSGFVKIEE